MGRTARDRESPRQGRTSRHNPLYANGSKRGEGKRDQMIAKKTRSGAYLMQGRTIEGKLSGGLVGFGLRGGRAWARVLTFERGGRKKKAQFSKTVIRQNNWRSTGVGGLEKGDRHYSSSCEKISENSYSTLQDSRQEAYG